MTSHARRMDAIYAHQRHFYDLTRKYYLLGRDRLIAQLDVPPGGTVLEFGCGTGRNLIAAARRYPTARLFGIDISEAMLETAGAKITAAGLAHRIALKRGDATTVDTRALFGVARFDRVFFSYTLSMIPDWRAALQRAASVTGGTLHLVDFGQFEKLPCWFGRAMFAWLAKFDVEPRGQLFNYVAHELSGGFSQIFCLPHFRDYARSAMLAR